MVKVTLKDRRKDGRIATIHYAAALALLAATYFTPARGRAADALFSRIDRFMTKRPVSEMLLNRTPSRSAMDNVVEIYFGQDEETGAPQEVGSGVLENPWQIRSVHHVLVESAERCTPLRIRSDSYLGRGTYLETVPVPIGDPYHCGRPANTLWNLAADSAILRLDHPLYEAHVLERAPYGPMMGIDLQMITYRAGQLFNSLGRIVTTDFGDKYPTPIYWATDINGGPGNSGGPIVDTLGRLVGNVSRRDPRPGQDPRFENNEILITSVWSPNE